MKRTSLAAKLTTRKPQQHEPVRERSSERHAVPQPAIPSITEGDFMLSFAREEGHAFSVLLSFPGALGPRYPIRGYPVITEFRAMLTVLASCSSSRSWSGAYFIGGVAESQENGPAFWFRAHDNGITFRFSSGEWQSVQALMRRAWDIPDIRTACDAVAFEYGEL
jgi:hypothetical protein